MYGFPEETYYWIGVDEVVGRVLCYPKREQENERMDFAWSYEWELIVEGKLEDRLREIRHNGFRIEGDLPAELAWLLR